MSSDSFRVTRTWLSPLLRPVASFFAAESAGGIVLLASAIAALLWANSPWGQTYKETWHGGIGIRLGEFVYTMSFHHFVNDGLMVMFFLLVGLEIKRELIVGELASVRRASLPVAAAMGGMIVPALIFATLNARGSGARGWGVPMATDIAFAAGVLTLIARRLPTSVKVLLLAVAIVDDLGAVLVIALFYTQHISLVALSIAGLFLAALVALNLLRIHSILPYAVLGTCLWAATLYSGVHATIAGVLLAFTIPASRQIEESPYLQYVRRRLVEFERDAKAVPDLITENQSHALKAMERASQGVQTPLARLEHALLKPVNFLIVPLFALANAGLDFDSVSKAGFKSPVLWGVLLGLVIGKPLGILLASGLATRMRIAALPEGVNWRQVVGVSILCGIGFTMSLFVATLAFGRDEPQLAACKLGILTASAVSGLAGAGFFALTQNQRTRRRW